MSVQVKGSGTIGGLDEGLVVSGIVTSSTQVNVGSNIKLGNAGVITATSFVGSGANLTSLPAQVTISSNADNRVITGGSGTNLVGESVLTFDSSTDTLQIHQQNAGNNPALKVIHRGSAASDIGFHYEAYDGSGDVVITNSGRFGIGDTSPDRELVVKNASSNSTIKIEASNSHTSQLFFSDTDAENVARIGVFHGSGQSTSNAMVLETGGSARLMINSSGSIQVTPEGSTSNPYMLIDTSGDSVRFSAKKASGNNEFRFLTQSSGTVAERLRITSTGDVIIRGTGLNNSSVVGQALQIQGTTRPTLILRGNASGGNTCEIQFADNSGTDSDPGTRVGLIKYEHAGTYANHMHFHTNETERVVISHSGRFGIANSPAELAGFAENFQVTGLYGNQYAAAFKIKQSSGSLMRFATYSGGYQLCGGITVNGTSTSFNTSSDYRLKENDVKISDGIARLKQLRPIRFNWKSDSSTTEDGFFAHEVSPVVPESVNGEKDATIDEIGEGYQKIDHSKLVPLLTAALQEAIARIEALEGS